MGGTAVQNGPLSMIQFPGVFIMLRKLSPTAPPAGSIVDHIGFGVERPCQRRSPNGKLTRSRSSRLEIRTKAMYMDQTGFA